MMLARALLIVSLLSVASSAAGADIVLREKFPTEGADTELFVQGDDGAPIAGAEITVTYRPGSSVEAVEIIGVTGESGRIVWRPSGAGIAAVNAVWDGGTSSTNVSVRFASAPLSGIVIMILAGLLLVGGSAVRIRRVLNS